MLKCVLMLICLANMVSYLELSGIWTCIKMFRTSCYPIKADFNDIIVTYYFQSNRILYCTVKCLRFEAPFTLAPSYISEIIQNHFLRSSSASLPHNPRMKHKIKDKQLSLKKKISF